MVGKISSPRLFIENGVKMNCRGLVTMTATLLFICAGYALSQNLDSNNLEPKSRKNWFAKNIKIISKQVTTQDLLNSPGADWLIYHGDYRANHYSPLSEINRQTVKDLVPKWIYKINDGAHLRSSPIIYQGIMYVTAANEVHALDAKTGQWFWIWQAYKKRSISINRGVAIYGDKILFSTSDCKLVALNKETGDLVWFNQYASSVQGYFSTMAPLIIGDAVVTGVSNGNNYTRGFIVAFSVVDGRELWRFWTLPDKGPLLGASTWLTGSYDSVTDTIYWAVGTVPDKQRGDRQIYNTPKSYHDSIIALDAKTGKLKWQIRLAKHLPIDWDPNEPLVLIDSGQRKLILLANRSGMYYLIDRKNGEIIFEKPFINKLNWDASKGVICPSVRGATNWMPPSFSPLTKLFYVMTLEGCVDESNQYFAKALDPLTGNIKWTYPVRGINVAMPGILSTAGNVVFSSEGSGHVMALDAISGDRLWEFNTGWPIFASPVTYLIGGREYLTIVAGSDVINFGLHKAQ